MAIVRGALIQVVIGMDKGRVGTVIGTINGRLSEMAILVVFFEDNKLDTCVLPEMVRVLSEPDDSEIVWLSDAELQALFSTQ